ncbi:hypothetical protein J4457_01560 [Candidatus Woesearchaeota archaeon]|nr:hypothetical protein [Candidatus Woesearchaeota archaeon]
MENNKPEKTFRAGAISATIWNNTAQNKEGLVTTYSNVTFERCYKDTQGQWKSTNALRINDLPKAQAVLQRAYEYLVFKEEASA